MTLAVNVDIKQCASLLQALAAPERLNLIRLLAEGPRNVTDISDSLGVPMVNLTHHLNVLKHARLIQGQKKGRFVWYSLCDNVLTAMESSTGSVGSLNLGCCQLLLSPIGEEEMAAESRSLAVV